MSPTAILWAIRVCVGLVALAIPFGFGYSMGGKSARAELAQVKADYADAALYAERNARQQEQAHALALSAIAQEYEDDKEAAKRDHARLVADLRRGTVRLQDHWTCPSGVPPVGPGTGSADEVARLREQGAADLIAAADECDAQVLGLQAVTQQDRASQ